MRIITNSKSDFHFRTILDKDSWKILTKKLDTVKSSKDRFGKIVLKEDQVVDELKCVHFGVCSGCTIRGEFLSSTPILQRAKRYFASENITLQGLIFIFQWCSKLICVLVHN